MTELQVALATRLLYSLDITLHDTCAQEDNKLRLFYSTETPSQNNLLGLNKVIYNCAVCHQNIRRFFKPFNIKWHSLNTLSIGYVTFGKKVCYFWQEKL